MCTGRLEFEGSEAIEFDVLTPEELDEKRLRF